MELFDRLKQIIDETEDDVQKAEGGNKAAGTRVRKAMQEVKAAAQEIRKQILEIGKGGS
ncbi:MAG TPA: histone H1 [Phycisphaeraceae bacterium]|nr:histone H1 [Phycisphaeraceae bacterium]